MPRVDPIARATVRWFSNEEGGRDLPPTGPVYGATAVFLVTGDIQRDIEQADHFSIALSFKEGEAAAADQHEADVDFLARDLVAPRLVEGAKLLILEGVTPIAECEITHLY